MVEEDFKFHFLEGIVEKFIHFNELNSLKIPFPLHFIFFHLFQALYFKSLIFTLIGAKVKMLH